MKAKGKVMGSCHPRRLLLILALLFVPPWAAADTLAEMLRAVRGTQAGLGETAQDSVQGPSAAELAYAEALFRRLFAGESGPALRRQWAALGFALTGTRSEADPMLVLQEIGAGPTQSQYVGKGFFVFALGRDSKTVLQVPHSFVDPETQDIGLALMAARNFRAAAWNTAPVRGPVHSSLPVDLHAAPRRDYLLAFTRALMSIDKQSRVVQLHSFEQQKMYSTNARHADIILSGYGEQPNQAIGWLNRCLKERLDYTVRSFPFEVREMGVGKNIPGASENLIGAAMQAAGSQGFVHLAMSGGFREELRSYPRVQEMLFACLSRD